MSWSSWSKNNESKGENLSTNYIVNQLHDWRAMRSFHTLRVLFFMLFLFLLLFFLLCCFFFWFFFFHFQNCLNAFFHSRLCFRSFRLSFLILFRFLLRIFRFSSLIGSGLLDIGRFVMGLFVVVPLGIWKVKKTYSII